MDLVFACFKKKKFCLPLILYFLSVEFIFMSHVIKISSEITFVRIAEPEWGAPRVQMSLSFQSLQVLFLDPQVA